jgi:hypothetical protein
MLYLVYAVLGACCTRCMLYLVYAVLGACCTLLMLHLAYAALSVCCTWRMLYSAYTALSMNLGCWHVKLEMDDSTLCSCNDGRVVDEKERDGGWRRE